MKRFDEPNSMRSSNDKYTIQLFIAVVLTFLVTSLLFIFVFPRKVLLDPLSKALQSSAKKDKPLEKYTFKNLRNTTFTPSEITIGKRLSDEEMFVSYMFDYSVEGKKVSGLINIPKKKGTCPVIVLNRGFVDRSIYATGLGSKRVGEALAKSGYITLAPDFLGYGESDFPSIDSIEERFQTYTTDLTLLASIVNLNKPLTSLDKNEAKADTSKVGIWGHSNGGQISLSVLAISGKPYPTVLWAPVSKPFPHSVLFFTDEFDDHGKALRKVLANFEQDYDIENYSPTNYFDLIQSSIQLHQGTADDAVPVAWSNSLVEDLRKKNKKIEYFTYPGADHNLAPDGWSTAVSRTISFFDKELGK